MDESDLASGKPFCQRFLGKQDAYLLNRHVDILMHRSKRLAHLDAPVVDDNEPAKAPHGIIPRIKHERSGVASVTLDPARVRYTIYDSIKDLGDALARFGGRAKYILRLKVKDIRKLLGYLVGNDLGQIHFCQYGNDSEPSSPSGVK